ncbi:helix-turn-helix domain-containing protein [Streptomyces sp. NPDC055722]
MRGRPCVCWGVSALVEGVVAALFRVSVRTADNWWAKWQAGGRDALLSRSRGRRVGAWGLADGAVVGAVDGRFREAVRLRGGEVAGLSIPAIVRSLARREFVGPSNQRLRSYGVPPLARFCALRSGRRGAADGQFLEA